MTTAYTSLLGLALPVTGELSGTWGTVVNDSITSLLDTSVAGTTNVSADSNVTLTTTTGASNQARQAILLFSGARTAIRTVTAPAQSKIYTVINATTGGFAVTLVGAGPTTGLTIPNGASATVAWNGSDFIEIGTASIGNLTVNGNLTVTGTSTLTGAITNTAGTANGVAYLNGSKVVTSGSALTFDGTSLGVGTASPSGRLHVANTGTAGTTADNLAVYFSSTNRNSNVYILAKNTDGSTLNFGDGDSSTVGRISYDHASNYMAFDANGSEQMRLTSTGLGIGTSSPASKLQISSSSGGDTSGLRITRTDAGGGDWRIWSTATANGEGAGKLIFGTGSNYMTLDGSGNLGVGTTSPVSKIDARAASATMGNYQTIQAFSTDATAVNLGGGISLGGNYSGSSTIAQFASIAGRKENGTDGNYAGYLQFGTASQATGVREVARITSAGNLGINADNPAEKLHVITATTYAATFNTTVTSASSTRISIGGLGSSAGGSGGSAAIGNATNHGATAQSSLTFYSHNGSTLNEVGRFDPDGNLLVGTTSTGGSKFEVYASAEIARFYNTSGQGTIRFVDGNNVTKGSIVWDSTLTVYNTTSDYRLKNVTGTLTGYKERLMSLQPKQGTWVADGSEFRGFLAHEFANPYRASVTGEKDAVDDDGKPIYQGMQASSSEVMADLVAMVNELITENASLKARLDAANL